MLRNRWRCDSCKYPSFIIGIFRRRRMSNMNVIFETAKAVFTSFKLVKPVHISQRYRELKPYFRRYGYRDPISLKSGTLPRTDEPLPIPKYEPKDAWSRKRALFGQNDYIDILGDGKVHPSTLMYHIPHWLRGFAGNEMQRLIRQHKMVGWHLEENRPTHFKNLRKRIKRLYRFYNLKLKTAK